MHRAFIVTLIITTSLTAHAMDLVWTRGTGQYRCEATPALVDSDGDGQSELLTVNVGGQLMLWNLDGTPKGAGQDGTVAELPKGEWSSMPLPVVTPQGLRNVAGNTAGLIVCLDNMFKTLWTYQLPGKTQWSRAVPAVVDTKDGILLCIGDQSGAVTCLKMDGSVAWGKSFGSDPVRTYLTAYTAEGGAQRVLVAAGQVIYCINTSGATSWTATLGAPPTASGQRPPGDLLAKPAVFSLDGAQRIVCANGVGRLFMFDDDGKELWHADTNAEVDASITLWETQGASPLIVCTGVWGDAYAFDVNGKTVWRHAFRSKNRAHPVVADVNGDGSTELVIAAYNQHVYALDRRGCLVDDLRLAGSVNASPILIPGTGDLLFISTTLLAHRVRPSQPHAVYGESSSEGNVNITIPLNKISRTEFIVVNDAGRLVRLNVMATLPDNSAYIFSRLSAADHIELQLPERFIEAIDHPGFVSQLTVEASAPNGEVLDKKVLMTNAAEELPALRAKAWGANPYAPIEDVGGPAILTVPLYQGECDEASFVVDNDGTTQQLITISMSTPTSGDGKPLDAKLALYKLVAVSTLNGEQVLDALVPVINNQIEVAPKSRTKVWLAIDTGQSAPGIYRGSVSLHATAGDSLDVSLPLAIAIDSLRMPEKKSLVMCTWDYVPNKWFPDNTPAVLNDMQHHGVNVFPRTSVPPATCDGTALTFDWSVLDSELARIEGRGFLLLQLAEPPITFAQPPSDSDKRRFQLDYVRAVRDHLGELGRGYGAFALYPVDEPGLDYDQNAKRMIQYGQLFREADPKILIYTDPVPGLSQRDFEQIKPLVDIWCPNMRLVSGLLVSDPRMTTILSTGKPVWSYECVSEVRSLSPLRYNRANAWRANYFGLDGIGFWTHSTTQVDPWLTDTTKNDEYALVYPGPTPVSSVRWEAARDGIEDATALHMLEQAIAEAKAKNPASDAVKRAEDMLRFVRTGVMEMADEAYVESRDFLKKGDREIQHTTWDAEAFARYRIWISEATHALMAAAQEH